jgi:hypothetical protein
MVPPCGGHVITLPEQAGGGIRVVARTNCRLESLNGDIKHGERRREEPSAPDESAPRLKRPTDD